VSISDVRLQQLRTLLAVADTGSISAAARQLAVTQPFLSRSIRQLEQQYGVTLLHRSARGVTLTPFGASLVQRARRIDAEVRRSHEEIVQLRGGGGGRVNIACGPVPMMLFVPQAIQQVRESFAGVEVHVREVVFPELMDAFRDDSIDFAVGPAPRRGLGREYRVENLLPLDLAVTVRRGHPRGRARSLRELQQDDWIVTGPRGGPGAVVEETFCAHGLAPPSCTTYLGTAWAALEMIKNTDLVAFVPRLVAQAEAGVQVIRVPEQAPQQRICLLFRRESVLTPAAGALLSAIRASARQWRGRDG
jgi:DNA-binding transcriptional LysR family regulator